MSNAEALLLGIVQGLTEFLPISSSGHLILVPWLQSYTFLQENESFNKTFDVALHAGTLVAAVAYFRVEVVMLLRGFWEALRQRAMRTQGQRLSVAIAIGTVPAVIIGGLGSGFIDEHLGEPWMIAIQLILFAALLGYADRMPERRDLGDAGLRDGWIVGLAQVLALAPGTSRSGITITAARWLRPRPPPPPPPPLLLLAPSAPLFPSLRLIPAVAGPPLFKAASAVHEGLPPGVAGPMVVGTVAAAVSG